jgi:hypothetical protein
MNDIPIIFKRSPKVVAAAVDDKAFLLHIEDWVYLELNESGSRIWELLDDGKSAAQIVEDLGQSFNVNREVCALDTSEFLATLEEKHFVTRE